MSRVSSIKAKKNLLTIAFVSEAPEPPAYGFEATDWKFDDFGMLHIYDGTEVVNIINMTFVLFIEVGDSDVGD